MCSELLPLMSVPEVAARLHVSEKSAWRFVASGKFAKVKVGARTLVTPESVQAFIDQGGGVCGLPGPSSPGGGGVAERLAR